MHACMLRSNIQQYTATYSNIQLQGKKHVQKHEWPCSKREMYHSCAGPCYKLATSEVYTLMRTQCCTSHVTSAVGAPSMLGVHYMTCPMRQTKAAASQREVCADESESLQSKQSTYLCGTF